jgi:DNA-binding transcriptional LysR family regulator
VTASPTTTPAARSRTSASCRSATFHQSLLMSALVIRRPVGGFPNPDSCLTLSTHSHRAGGFTFDPGPIRGLSTHQIFEEKLCLAVPSDHSFAALPSIRAEQPAGEPLIATPQTWPRPYATPTCASSAPAASRQPLGWKRNFSRRSSALSRKTKGRARADIDEQARLARCGVLSPWRPRRRLPMSLRGATAISTRRRVHSRRRVQNP